MNGRQGMKRMFSRNDKRLALLAAVFLVAFACGCGTAPDKSASGTTKVAIVIGSRTASASPAGMRSVLPRAIPPNVDNVRVTVSASDITTIVQEATVAPGANSVTMEFDVPDGTNRLFVVEVFDTPHTLLYRGDNTITLSGNPADGSPVEISVLLDHYFSFLASGPWHAVVVKPGGEIWAFGLNDNSQLGNTSSSGPGPVQVMGGASGTSFLGGIKAAAGGMSHTVALMGNGTVWTWGLNVNGQLGDNTHIARNVPVQVVNLNGTPFTGVDNVAAGDSHTVARKSDGTVWTWGYNQFGQLGNGNLTDSSVPVQVFHSDGTTPLTGVVAVAAGGFHTIALKSDGAIWTWGDNFFGQLGDGSTTRRVHPVQVGITRSFIGIAGGDAHTVALKAGGTVWAWGLNANGQLGDGTIIDRYSPVRAGSSLTGVQSVASGGFHSIALKSDWTVWTWGQNDNGQLGDATISDSYVPVQVKGAGGTGTLAGVRGIAGGYTHSLALKNDGTVWAWGNNGQGQLGVDSSLEAERRYPGKILGF